MKRPRPTLKPNRAGTKIPGVPSRKTSCRALVWVDGTPIRKKARKDYEKARKDLARARTDLERFEGQDSPKFVQWLNATFGQLLTALRETAQKLQEKQGLLFEIESEVMFEGGSHAQAFKRVTQRRQHPESAIPSDPPPPPKSHAPPPDKDSEEREMREEFEKFFEDIEDMFREANGMPRRPPEPPVRPMPDEEQAARLKDLYRALVRRLHPDRQAGMSAQKMEWWHQAQAAYREGDAEQLEVILSLCEIDEQGSVAQTSVSILQRITRQFKNSLREIKARLNASRNDPAWNFSKRTDLSWLHQHMRGKLETELALLRENLAAVENVLARWEQQASKPARKKRRREPAQSAFEFPF